VAQPGDPYTVTDLESGGTSAPCGHDADHFMSWSDSAVTRGEITFGQVQVGAAHAARPNVEEHLAWSWDGLWSLDPAQR
jgi:hypothetical protein